MEPPMSLIVLNPVNVAAVEDEGQYVTFAHLSSESSDHYYLTFEGAVTYEQVKAEIEENWHNLGVDDPEVMYVESLQCVRVG
jgi:hypothetical protein